MHFPDNFCRVNILDVYRKDSQGFSESCNQILQQLGQGPLRPAPCAGTLVTKAPSPEVFRLGFWLGSWTALTGATMKSARNFFLFTPAASSCAPWRPTRSAPPCASSCRFSGSPVAARRRHVAPCQTTLLVPGRRFLNTSWSSVHSMCTRWMRPPRAWTSLWQTSRMTVSATLTYRTTFW
jgi:hypothetical protein